MAPETNEPDSASAAAPAPSGRDAPLSRSRLTIVMVLAVYPLVTALLYLLGPLTRDWQVWHRTLILTPVTVASIVFIVTPMVNRYLGTHLRSRRKPTKA